MLSRTADSLFWLNRYIERSDVILRLVYVHYILSLDQPAGEGPGWKTVLRIATALEEKAIESLQDDTPAVLFRLLVDSDHSNSIRCLINRARENARGAQDHITKEVWEAVNGMYLQASQVSLPARLRGDEALKVLESFVQANIQFTGIADNTMWRGLGWNFMQLGKFIERCLQTMTVTARHLELLMDRPGALNEVQEWRPLLFSLSGYEHHLKTYRSPDPCANVLHQVLLNEDFTRSVLYSLTRIHQCHEQIRTIHQDPDRRLERPLGQLLSRVRYLDLATMDPPAVVALLSELRGGLLSFSNQIAQSYFSYT